MEAEYKEEGAANMNDVWGRCVHFVESRRRSLVSQHSRNDRPKQAASLTSTSVNKILSFLARLLSRLSQFFLFFRSVLFAKKSITREMQQHQEGPQRGCARGVEPITASNISKCGAGCETRRRVLSKIYSRTPRKGKERKGGD